MRIISFLLMIIILIMGIAFAATNAQLITVNYLIGSASLPLALVLLIAFVVGVLLSYIYLGAKVLKLKAQHSWMSAKLKNLQHKSEEKPSND